MSCEGIGPIEFAKKNKKKRKKTVFLVIKVGVYRHNTLAPFVASFGIYTTLYRAQKARERALSLEHDDHHDFEIEEVELNSDCWVEKLPVFWMEED